MSDKPKIVFDTQIMLRAAINRRSLPAKLFYDWRNDYQLIYSTETKAELVDVLSRSSIRKRFVHINDDLVAGLLQIYELAEQVALPNPIPAISRDPKDDMFLACALAGQAQYVVSEDNDLLVLKSYEGIEVINALDFLQILQANVKDE